MKSKAVIFDLDDTLVYASRKYKEKAISRTLLEFGVDCKDPETLVRIWDEAGDKSILQGLGVDLYDFWSIFEKYQEIKDRMKHTCAYPDSVIVKQLKDRGYKIGIVTGSQEYVASEEIKLVGAENFDVVVVANGRNGVQPKPHPQGIEECLNLLCVEKENAVYVGNAVNDVMAAKNAGIPGILLCRGDFMDVRIKECKASYKIPTLHHLLKILEKYNSNGA